MIYVVLSHSRRLVYDLEQCARDGSWTVSPDIEPFRCIGLIAGNEIVKSMESYYVNQDMQQFQQGLITAAMKFNQGWSSWLETVNLRLASKAFHGMLLRFSKGCVKAWRIWLIDK